MRSSFFAQLNTRRFWIVVLLTVVAFSILVNLGLWQLSRAEEKREIEQQVSQRDSQQWISLGQISADQLAIPTGVKVEFQALPVKDRYLLLDNQNYQSEVGYIALQLVKAQSGESVLLERGFIRAPKLRTQLPEVNWLVEPMKVQGRLYRKSPNPLSQDLYLESGVPSRIQNLNYAQLEKSWGIELARYVVQPQVDNWPYPQPWQPVAMKSEKHHGYAVQWFSMAAALLLLSSIILIRLFKQGAQR
ncbi:SURF1 family protein [Vibrio ouci]|uniref:SURF1-like protein n=1 Tax=Vibrio ouci TaxID=2499078 RepID=A0A4Y8WCL0_9VIBR|nr:SURF1 family protein [Vibrio ouci]TFH90315.1 SURF1 family protein [Vibrio ouci]